MRLQKFNGVDAFVALDLAGAGAASGPVRWARRVLHAGARDLARSQTYTYAALQMRRGGASAGISAEAPGRDEAVAAFVAEAASLVSGSTYLPDAAKGVTERDLASLRAADPRAVARFGAFAAGCDALSAAVAADAAAGLDGSTLVIEGLSPTAVALAAEAAARGGRVVAVSTAQGCLTSPEGFDPAALAGAWSAHGEGALGALAGDGLTEPETLWSQTADIVFAGSKMGVVNHATAAALQCRALVPCGRLPYSAKALAVCRRRGIAAVADFVALAGSTVSAWSGPGTAGEQIRSEIADAVTSLMADALESEDGPFLGACYSAEAFLSTWQEQLPFGRPLAS